MLPGLLPKLLEVYGPGRVVDVFKETGLEEPAHRLGVGGYVVRNALSDDEAANWHRTLHHSMEDIALREGPRSVDLKGTRLWYRTTQCTTARCTCTYGYDGTARNPVFRTEHIEPFKHVCDWVHTAHKVPRQEHFDECVANIYSRQSDQCTHAHTDHNQLLEQKRWTS